MSGKQKYLCYSLFAALVAGSLSTHAAIIFEEQFDNPGADRGIGSITPNSWYAHTGQGKKLAEWDGVLGDGTVSQNWLLNASAEFLFFGPANNTAKSTTLAWSDSISFDLSDYAGDEDTVTFEFSLRNNNQTDTTRIALQVDGNWYASDSSYAHNDTNTNWSIHSLTFTPKNDEVWRALAFDGTSASDSTVGNLVLDSESLVGLPLGDVTAVGFFFQGVGFGTNRLDDFFVTAVPEPSAYALLGGLTAFGFLLLRRRRK